MSRLERGDVGATPETLQAIADALGVPIAAITTGGNMTTSTAAGTALQYDDAELYEIPEAARRIKKSPDWVIKAVRKKEIEHTRVGRKVLFSDANIRAFIARNCVPAEVQQSA